MAIHALLSLAVHVLVGAVWVGAVVFTVGAVLPVAREGRLNADPLGAIAERLRTVTRASAVLLLLTGGHLLWARGYLDGALFSSGAGHLVVTMAILWLVATGLTEVGAARLVDGTDDDKVREPAREATRLLQAAGVTGALILVDAAALITVV
jgi:uncharacterized membrane protein